jgi:ABC-type phosphate transport system substrate-binding protein
VAESDPSKPEEVAALSDGGSDVYRDRLRAEKIAIISYLVVVNSGVGLTTLSVEDLRKIYKGTWTDWNQVPGAAGTSVPISIVGRGQDSGTREVFEKQVLQAGEPSLTSDDCRTKNRAPDARVVRCERNDNAEVIQEISTTAGAIGYADVASIRKAREDGTVDRTITALTLDGKAFDASTAVESGYPFWTVEYLYTKGRPDPDSLTANFFAFVRGDPIAGVRLTEAGFTPCKTPERRFQELCDLR